VAHVRFVLSIVLELAAVRCLETKPVGVACAWTRTSFIFIECEFVFLHALDANVEIV
jgi:hypothetical protein